MSDKLQSAKKWAKIQADFYADVAVRYRQHCKRIGIEPTLEGLLEYTQGMGLLYKEDIGLYMVKALYPEALYRNDCRKIRAVFDLQERIPFDDRRIRRAIKLERSFSYERNAGKPRRKIKG